MVTQSIIINLPPVQRVANSDPSFLFGQASGCHVRIYACIFAYARLLLPVAVCTFGVHVSGRFVSILSQAIFKPCCLQRALAPLPHILKCLCGNVSPHTRRIPLVFPSPRPCIGESNPPLAEMSATIKVSPDRRGNAFERLCVLVGGGLEEHTGMSYVPSWHEQDSSECQ